MLALEPGNKKKTPLRIIVTMLLGAAAIVGVMFLALVIWFFTACANNPDCLTFG